MESRQIVIDGNPVGPGHPAWIIAELSGNHQQDINQAKAMIDAAAEAGVDAVKLQTYRADTITLDSDRPDFIIKESDSLWAGRKLYDLYNEAHTPWDWHQDLFDHARKAGVTIFSSPFDETAVDLLEALEAPCYKIASFELNHTPLLRRVAQTGKPVIMSTGMATYTEIAHAVKTLKHHGCEQLALLKCTSAYPARPEDANLHAMKTLAEEFGVVTGLSDHVQGIDVSAMAIALGASMIERHFVLDAASDAVDAAFSSTPQEMKALVSRAGSIQKTLGDGVIGPRGGEKVSRQYRRSIYVSADIRQGDILGPHNLKVVRPGFGLSPDLWNLLQGQRATKPANAGEAMTRDIAGFAASEKPGLMVRVDANDEIGLGHLSRCETLISAVQASGVDCFVVSRDEMVLSRLDGLCDSRTYKLEDDIDETSALTVLMDKLQTAGLLLDGYQYSAEDVRVLKQYCPVIMFDDVVNRDACLEASLAVNAAMPDAGGLPEHYLAGSRFAMIPPLIEGARKTSPALSLRRHVFICFGGADMARMTAPVVHALGHLKKTGQIPENLQFDVVCGKYCPEKEAILKACDQFGFSFHFDDAHIVSLMQRAGLAISACGSMAYELAFSGVPSVLVPVADNQRLSAKAQQQAGWAIDILPEVLEKWLQHNLMELWGDLGRRKAMSESALGAYDDLGAGRLATAIVNVLEGNAI